MYDLVIDTMLNMYDINHGQTMNNVTMPTNDEKGGWYAGWDWRIRCQLSVLPTLPTINYQNNVMKNMMLKMPEVNYDQNVNDESDEIF